MEAESSGDLRELAEKCRRLARSASSADVAATLRTMADDYQRKAEAAACDAPTPQPPNPAG